MSWHSEFSARAGALRGGSLEHANVPFALRSREARFVHVLLNQGSQALGRFLNGHLVSGHVPIIAPRAGVISGGRPEQPTDEGSVFVEDGGHHWTSAYNKQLSGGEYIDTILQVIERFNEASAELQTSEFRRAKTPSDWKRMAKSTIPRDYGKLFNAVSPFLEVFEGMTSDERAGIGTKLNPDAVGILWTFASSMAVLAVRQTSPTLIAQGLASLAILADVEDGRDLCFPLAKLYHSAEKLEIDTRKVFEDGATLVTPGFFRNQMQGFPSRQPKHRDLRAFRIREMRTAEGYDLVQEPLDALPRGYHMGKSRAWSRLKGVLACFNRKGS